MSNISVLHLGGNALTGSIPEIPISPSLSELVLANNAFTNTIPQYIWDSNIAVLDLSYNRFKGRLPTDLLSQSMLTHSENITIKLQVNQFSGEVPSSLLHLPPSHVNILDGNLFSCDVHRDDIPDNDPHCKSYNCGSNSTDFSLILFCSILFAGGICIALSQRLKSAWYSWYHGFQYTLDYQKLFKLLHDLQQLNTRMSCVGTLIGLLLFGILSHHYSTYVDSYIWTISAIYMSGEVPAICLLIWFIICIMRVTWKVVHARYSRVLGTTRAQQSLFVPKPISKDRLKRWWATACVVLFNVVVVTVVNGFYVNAVRSNYSFNQLTLIAVSLSLFKYVWRYLLIKKGNSIVEVNDKTIIGLCLFNNLVAPFLAEMFVSSDCFLYLVSQAPLLVFKYIDYGCNDNSIDMSFGEIDVVQCGMKIGNPTLTADPPFHYSHQCSFSLISSYSSVVIYRYVLSGVLVPLVIWILRATVSILPCDNAFWVPAMWRLSALPNDIDLNSTHMERFRKDIKRLEFYVKNTLRQQFVAYLVTDFAMLICFGAVFPPIAIVVGISLLKDITDIKLALGRYHRILETITDDGLKQQMLALRELINHEYLSGEKQIMNGIWFGLCISSGIWAMILFDILSATEGIPKSIWIVIVIVFSPYVSYMLFTLVIYKHKENEIDKINDKTIYLEDSEAKITTTVNPLRKANLEQLDGDVEMERYNKNDDFKDSVDV